jgi:RNA exonuclease 4
MPHVKGNKFKPYKLKEEAAPPTAPAEDVGAAAAEQPPPKKRRKTAPPSEPRIATVVLAAPKGKPSSSAAATPNWATLRAALRAKKPADRRLPRKRPAAEEPAAPAGHRSHAAPAVDPSAQPTRVLALDCEMVGAGPDGERSLLARVCVVNAAGSVLYDTFVRPSERVTDYRTRWSGVRAGDLRDAPAFEAVQAAVAALLRGRLLVGHAVENDLKVLALEHPPRDVRDTSRYPPLMKTLVNGKTKPRALRHLAREQLGLLIQEREHSPAEDARAALSVYQKHKLEWERGLAQRGGGGKGAAAPRAAAVGPPGQALASGKAYAAQVMMEMASNDFMADL